MATGAESANDSQGGGKKKGSEDTDDRTDRTAELKISDSSGEMMVQSSSR